MKSTEESSAEVEDQLLTACIRSCASLSERWRSECLNWKQQSAISPCWKENY